MNTDRTEKLSESYSTIENNLPEGWTEITLNQILQTLESGSRPKGGVRGIKEGIPSIGGEHINENGGFRFETIKFVPHNFFKQMNHGYIQTGDILIVKDGATTGKVALVRDDFPYKPAVVNEHVFICRPEEAVHPLFLFYFLFSKEGQDRILENFRGSAQGGINQSFATGTTVPLAPLPEQKWIVAKIEVLIIRVNAVRERLAKVQKILKRFRQAVLAAACSGRLTAEWRERHKDIEPAIKLLVSQHQIVQVKKKMRAGRLWGAGVVPALSKEEYDSLPTAWAWAKVRDIGENPDDTVQIGPMSMRSRDFTDQGVPILNVGCVQWGYFDKTKLDYLPYKIAKNFERYRIKKDDILFTRSGTVGRCAIASNKQDGYLMTFHLLRVRTTRQKCIPEYLLFIFQGAPHIRRQTDEGAIGSTRAGFNTNLLADLDVPLPPFDEQKEIVRRVKALFKLADSIEKKVAAASVRAEKLTQSILAKAFRGELIPTEAELARREGRSYEPASTLLTHIKAERESKEKLKAIRKTQSNLK